MSHTESNLTCVTATCGGEYVFVGRDGATHEFECDSCGHELSQVLPGALGTWARELSGGEN